MRLTSLACQESYGLQLASGNDMLMLILVSKTGNCNLDDIDALDKLFSLWHELKSSFGSGNQKERKPLD